MKFLKRIILIYILIALVICIYVFIYTNKNETNNFIGYIEEPVIENEITQKAKEIHDYMRENNYGYCTYDERCKHEGNCGLNTTFEKSKTNFHNTCCATYVSWVLQETGYLTSQEHVNNYLDGANNLIKYLKTKGWTSINKEDIIPGDILCYDGHVAIYGGNRKQYDAGNKELLGIEAPCIINWGMSYNEILRKP